MNPSTVVQQFADSMDQRDWAGLRALLAPTFSAHFVHSGSDVDAEGYVRYNADYPGNWRFAWEDVVLAGDRAVGRAKVSDQQQTYYVACFLTFDPAGSITELTEVWTDAVTGDG